MTLCTSCILPGGFPGISFNSEGICNHCRKSGDARTGNQSDEKKWYKQQFLELLNQTVLRRRIPGKGPRRSYDVLLALGGDKESAYTLWLLKQKYRLRIMTMTVDTGFLSAAALDNSRRITGELGVDHLIVKPAWKNLQKIFSAAADRELYPKRMLERASTICTSCRSIVRALCQKTAVEINIPLVAFGWSPGRAPLDASFQKASSAAARTAQQAAIKPLREILGTEAEAYFPSDIHTASGDRLPISAHPLAWEQQTQEAIDQEVARIGWRSPGHDDHHEICLLRAYADEMHVRRHGFHPAVWEVASLVREGILSRSEGYARIYEERSRTCIAAAIEKLARNGA